MRRCWIAWGLVVLLGIVVPTGPSAGQPLAEKIKEGREAIKGIVAYPPEVRLAILDLCTQPDLIVAMGKSKELPDVTKYPESVQKAAKTLAEHPGIVKTLNDFIGIAAIVGRFYSRSPERATSIADKLAAKLEQEEDAQKEKWIDLLKANQKALEEFADAVEDLNEAQQAAAASTAPAETAPAEEPLPETYYQAEVSGNSVEVYSGPTGEMIDYLLANADEYANAAAAALEYWQQYQNGELAEAIVKDLAGIADAADLIRDPDLLRDVAQLRKEFPGAKDRLSEHMDRIQNIVARRGEFPKLAQRVDAFGDRNPQHRVNDWRKNPRAAKRPAAGQSRRPQTRSRRRARPTSVRSGKRNSRQRVGAAQNRHRSSWGNMSRGRSGGRASRVRARPGRGRSGGRRRR
ncbi:MAG: hypothetical protein GXP25_06230 [Planctomycetes bacterium]|nr:hypothetical protein [Planctomycetota bacterium]